MAERQFGPYRLVRQVAVGGMAEIHLAKTKGIAGFEKYVALKMIHPNFAEDEQFIQMLIDEAKIAVQLQHVNIAQTFDLGRVGDHYYITMEYVDGCDLYKILRRSSELDIDTPIDVATFIGKEVTTGLDYAHRKKDMAGSPLSIVHRDVSPQNVLVSHAGEVKLVDFGIAKATSKARQTAAGVIKGKYYYMSPEQAWGDKLDHRSDIFSAGIVLYETLVGQMLYLEEDLHGLLDMVRRADIAPPSTLRPDVPPQLEAIVMKALSKAPGDRYQVAQDMANDLEQFLHGFSPVFTAQKLAKHLRGVMGDPVALDQAPAAPAVADPVISTLEIGDEDLLHDRSELRGDENSVIFRLDALQPGADNAAANAAARPVTPRPVLSRPASVPPTTRPASVPPTSRPLLSRPASVPPVSRPALPRVTQRPTTRPPSPVDVSAAAPRDVGDDTRPVTPRILPATTLSMDHDLDGIGERTVITAPPSPHGGGFAPDGSMLDGGFEPTMIEHGWSEPTATQQARSAPAGGDDELDHGHDHAAPDDDSAPTLPPRDRDADDEDGPTMTRSPAVRGPAAASSAITTKRPRGPGPAALTAHTPTPAVSELRKPSRSRRTPADGVPHHGSVLQALVGAAGSEPMPTRPGGGRGGPSDGVPPRDPVGQPPPNPPGTQPPPLANAGPQGYPSGFAPDPPGAQPGPSGYPGQPYPGPQYPGQQHPGQQYPGQQYPGQQYPGQAYPGQAYPGQAGGPAPGQPYPGQHQLPQHGSSTPQGYPQWSGQGQQGQQPQGQQPHMHGSQPPPFGQLAPPFGYQQSYPQMPTFTQQMRAMVELDEIPSQYKVQSTGPRWFALVLAALVAVAGAAIVTYFILRRDVEPAPTATLVINSVPEGATVFVDSQQLPDKTPTTFTDAALGKRHLVIVTLPRHRTVEKTVDVPPAGGEQRLSFALQAISGQILIDSSPDGAEILIKSELKGRTPANLVDIDIETTKQLELRHKDYGQRIVPLIWPDNGKITLHIDLKK